MPTPIDMVLAQPVSNQAQLIKLITEFTDAITVIEFSNDSNNNDFFT